MRTIFLHYHFRKNFLRFLFYVFGVLVLVDWSQLWHRSSLNVKVCGLAGREYMIFRKRKLFQKQILVTKLLLPDFHQNRYLKLLYNLNNIDHLLFLCNLNNTDHILCLRQIIPVPIDRQEFEDYYNGCCNGTIWPLFHSMPDRAVFQAHTWKVKNKIHFSAI